MSLTIHSETVQPKLIRPESAMSPTSPTSPRVRFSHDEPTSTVKKTSSIRSSGARVIRTFEEIDRIVPREEWYEELECGM